MSDTPGGDRQWKLTDEEAVRRVCAGDERAFEALFHRYYAMLCRFVERYVGSPDSAEEIVQQLFVRVWENRGTWDMRNSLKPYLFQAARNGAFNHLKREHVKTVFAERAASWQVTAGTGQPDPGPEQLQEAKALAEAFHRALEKIPEIYREVVLLRAREQLTYVEIAGVLGVPVKTVETRARRGIGILRRLLAPHL